MEEEQRSLLFFGTTNMGRGTGVDPPPTTPAAVSSSRRSHTAVLRGLNPTVGHAAAPVRLLGRMTSNDSHEAVRDGDPTTTAVAAKKSWRSFISFPKGVVSSSASASSAPASHEASEEEDQCRDNDKSVSQDGDDNDEEEDDDNDDDDTRTERVDPPPPHHHHHPHPNPLDVPSSSPPSLEQERTQLRRLMASATDAWIQQQSKTHNPITMPNHVPVTASNHSDHHHPHNQIHEVDVGMCEPHKTHPPHHSPPRVHPKRTMEQQQQPQRQQRPTTTTSGTTRVMMDGLSEFKSGGAARELKRSKAAERTVGTSAGAMSQRRRRTPPPPPPLPSPPSFQEGTYYDTLTTKDTRRKTPATAAPAAPAAPATRIVHPSSSSLSLHGGSTGREPEEIFSVEPEHGNHTLKLPLPDPEDPPGSNPDEGSYSLEDTFMRNSKVKTVKSKKEKRSKALKDPEKKVKPSMTTTTLSQEKPKTTTTHFDFGQALPILAIRSSSSSSSSSSYTVSCSGSVAMTHHPLPPVESSPLQNTNPRVTWVPSVKPPAAGQDHLKELDQVFLRDDKYMWVPARVLEYRPDYAVCAVDLPPFWPKMTITAPGNNNDDDNDGDEQGVTTMLHPSLLKDVSTEDLQHFITHLKVSLTDLRVARYAEYDAQEFPLSCLRHVPPEGAPDVADLHDPHLPGILYNLKIRFFHNKPYTRVGGDSLIAMNPFAWIPDLYETNTRDWYSNQLIWRAGGKDNEEQSTSGDGIEIEPHVYEISALAYHGLATTRQDQTILVTGESGSGKTETLKIVLHHLATVQRTRPGGVPPEHSTAKEILARVLHSVPVLEAFGNAKTLQNANSSRVGKLTQLQFQVEPQSVATMVGRDIPYTDLVGSIGKMFLLEKRRVVSHDQKERSFHIFYQLLSASTEFKRSIWPPLEYRTAHRYAYTAGEIGNADEDAAAWNDTLTALQVFRYDGDSLTTLLQALVIVLQLGNLIFECDPPKDPNSDTVRVKNGNDVSELAELMGINRTSLLESLTSRTLTVRASGDHEGVRVSMPSQNAKECCDSLAEEIYFMIFESLVQKVNNYTAYPEPLLDGKVKCAHIFLLDMCGLGSFDVDPFEQLSSSYSNERLHQKYGSDNLNSQQYDTEGIDFKDFNLFNDSLVAGNGRIPSAWKVACALPTGSMEAAVSKVKDASKGSEPLDDDDRIHRKWPFGVDNLSGSVKYYAQNFIHRSTDRLPEILIECAAKSSNHLIGEAFQSMLTDRALESARKLKNRKNSMDNHVQQFQGQLKDLMATIAGTKTRCIRCIKPNQDLIPRKTEHKTLLEQLECLGILASLAGSHRSFPFKLSYDFIDNRYRCLMTKSMSLGSSSKSSRVKKMLYETLEGLSKGNNSDLPFACGNTAVFLKSGAQNVLEVLRKQHLSASAIVIQTYVRRWVASRVVIEMKHQLSTIQSFLRMVLVRLRITKERDAATKIASFARRNHAMGVLRTMKDELAAVAARTIADGHPRRQSSFTNRVTATIMTPTIVRRIKDVPTLRADLKALTHRALMDRKDGGAKRMQTTKALSQTPGVPTKLFSEFQEIYAYLRAEIYTLKSDNEQLRIKLKSSETQTTSLKMNLEKTNAATAASDARIEELVHENDSLFKELHSARLESARQTNSMQKKQNDLEAQVALAKRELDDAKRLHSLRVSDLEKEVKEMESRCAEVQRRHEQETIVHEQRYNEQKKKMDDEYKLAQESHQKQMTRLVDMIGNGHSKQQSEVVKVTAELLTVRKEKDEEIMMLQHEIKALKASKQGSPRSIRAAVDPRFQQAQLLKQSTLRSRRASESDYLFQNLHALMTETCVLPRDVSEQDMVMVIEQQERGQKMYRLLESLGDLYRKEEASQQTTSTEALSLIKQYVSVTEPNRTVLDLNDRLMEAELQVCRLQEELKEMKHCKRCALRDSTTERRRRISGGVHWE